MISITQSKKRKIIGTSVAVIIWILIWQAVAMILNQKILLASPLKVFICLFTIWGENGFIGTVSFTMSRIIGGFLLGLIMGIILALVSCRFKAFETFMSPFVVTVKTIPVASFVVLALMWLSKDKLSVFISFLMVFPIIYTNVLDGLKNTDVKMHEVARIFELSFKKKLKYIWLPQIKPFLVSACRISLGLAWKSGIAAEVIGLPNGSIGEMLYESKIYFETVDLFAWTVIIVIISVVFEKLFLMLLKLVFSGLERA